jgi:predicted metal-binding protein
LSTCIDVEDEDEEKEEKEEKEENALTALIAGQAGTCTDCNKCNKCNRCKVHRCFCRLAGVDRYTMRTDSLVCAYTKVVKAGVGAMILRQWI